MEDKNNIKKSIVENVNRIRETFSTNNADLLLEANYHALVSDESEQLYSEHKDSGLKAKAKYLVSKSLATPDFINSQRTFLNSIKDTYLTEGASNTSVERIASFSKLLPEVLARSINMALAMENVSNVVNMKSNATTVSFLRRILGANSETTEALYDQLNSTFGGTGVHGATLDPLADSGDTDTGGLTPAVADGVDDAQVTGGVYEVGTGRTRIAGEALEFANRSKVSARIDQVQLTAGTRDAVFEVSSEALQDASAEYGVDLIRENMITMQSELYRAISAEMYGRLALVSKRVKASNGADFIFNFDSVGTANAENFMLKNAFLLQYIYTMRSLISKDTRESGLKFKVFATSKVIPHLLMIDTLHSQFATPNVTTDFNNISFFRGMLRDMEVFEVTDYGNDNEFVMVVGKGSNTSTSPIVYGNYVPFYTDVIRDPNTTHYRYHGKIRSGMIANPLGMDNLSSELVLAQNQKCKYARFLRITNA